MNATVFKTIYRELIDENAADRAAEELGIDEPTDPGLKIPWWIRVGHRIPGASRTAASRSPSSLKIASSDRLDEIFIVA